MLLAAFAPTWVARDRAEGACAAAAAGAQAIILDDGFQNPSIVKDISIVVVDAGVAGIGRPEKFFETLRDLGADIRGTASLADHQPLGPALLKRLGDRAARLSAQPVTTEKDAVRLPAALRGRVMTVPVRLVLEDWMPFDTALHQVGL